ncbi:phosphonate transport system substrate-binding protein [Natronobacillus azotifigens]|uniref:Phosphate/phosphite/phosphonate ABC transporter substrate-binding protein n=1 Tax=Natronobacillus azotifigens TaxID=472978 RepID=A0A9J6RDH4_9BACI|nr:phosphate/phosphite/phosphonate ABC transporter substrate-binding protein [Natronobacillus azotifigens]MCZ0703422.1 phosphate/phosphite/phosphonate ABC transporter substrate-binding protein [Natronobacillus azotifigens]
MLKRFVFLFALVLSVVTLSACGDEVDELVMGFIPSQDAGNIATTAEPLEEFLSEELGIPVRAEVMADFSGLIEAMRTQQVDIGFLNPFGFVQAEDRADVEVILKSIRHGDDFYVAQYTVPADSPIETLDDLIATEGLVWAYPDDLSTSGFLFPAKQLMDMGIENLDNHFQRLRVGGHDNAMMQLVDGQADFATTFNDARDTLEEEFPNIHEDLRVIGYTDAIPNDTISVRSELSDDLKQQITDAFMSLNENEEMLAIMNEIYTWDGIAVAESSDYDIVREVFAQFEDELSN